MLGKGSETSIFDLFDVLKNIVETNAGTSVELRWKQARKGEIYRHFLDIAKAREVLGYNTKCDVDKGLRDTWKWYRSKFL